MTQILTHQQIEYKIRRIAYQIYESHIDETEIILAGIESKGYIFAEKINTILKEICNIKVTLCKVKMDKKNPLGTVETSLSSDEYKDKCVVLVDDVLNSGTTLIYGVMHFLNVPLKQFKTAVLINRNHKRFPIKADFKGLSLSTSLQEHIEVRFEENNDSAWLN